MNLKDRLRGILLGLAIGDALGMPIDGLSHPNVRTFYKGIKEFRDDEKRGDLRAGQWTAHTQRALAIAKAWSEPEATPEERVRIFDSTMHKHAPRRPGHSGSSDLAASVGPIAAVAFSGGWGLDRVLEALRSLSTDPTALVGALAQVFAIQKALESASSRIDGKGYLLDVAESVEPAEERLQTTATFSRKLVRLANHLNDFPLDLQDQSGGTGPAVEKAVPFALAMVARGPFLPEATLLSAVNVGGASSAVGAICGALLGAFNGVDAFPEAWISGLEATDKLQECADVLIGLLTTRH